MKSLFHTRLSSLLLVVVLLLLALSAWEGSVCTPNLPGSKVSMAKNNCDGTLFSLVSKPSEVARQVANGDIDRDLLQTLAMRTGLSSIFALFLTATFSLGWYIIASESEIIRKLGYGALWLFQVVPYVAFAWVFSIFFGMYDKTAFGFVISLFPVLGSLFVAIKKIPADIQEILRMSGATYLTRVRHLYIPTAIPFFFGGLRVAAPLTVVGAMLADLSGGEGVGLGKEILLATRNAKPVELWIYTAAAIGVSLLLSVVVWACEQSFAASNPWYARRKSDES
jgi:ABC-type nitrate/sulfonate/bicarbonate transport system permease component